MKRVGLIVNPIAGLGGRVGLKGTDGKAIQQRALALGAVPHASDRATEAIKSLEPMKPDLEVVCYPGSMGEISACKAGFTPRVIGNLPKEHTTAEDTQQAVKDMLGEKLSLLLFAGGDGTARDILAAGGMEMITLGIPAGVKIQSAVYATHPRAAGELAVAYLQGRAEPVLAEVVDINEDDYRRGRLSPRIYGYLRVPYLRRYIQGAKVSSATIPEASVEGISHEISTRLKNGTIYIIGPGSTTRTIAENLGLEKSLLGVDAYLDGKLLAADVNESTLSQLLTGSRPAEIIVTPIGGQGCILGRGNQQISPEVIRKVGKEHILVVCTPEKLAAYQGRPLWVDTGDEEVDELLSGYLTVITGYKEKVFYKITR